MEIRWMSWIKMNLRPLLTVSQVEKHNHSKSYNSKHSVLSYPMKIRSVLSLTIYVTLVATTRRHQSLLLPKIEYLLTE